jgi:hypothetical protein
VSERERTIREPKRPVLFWAVFGLAGLAVAATGLALLGVL